MTDPVRLYNPNPDAPNVWGAPPTKRNALAETLANIPSPFGVLSPPPEARKAYGSLAQAVVDMTSPAAVRDTVDASGQTVNALREGRGWDAAGGAASMLTAAAGVVPGGRLITKGAKELAQPIRAYHGSPHDFDRFDMSKIGTGEGFQAYGHGLYFAENPAVAKEYQIAGRAPIFSYGGEKIIPSQDPVMNEAVKLLHQANGDKAAAQLAAKSYAYDNLLIPKIDGLDFNKINRGRMYEVNIHADRNAFLDWDKRVADQPPELLEVVKPFFSGGIPEYNSYREALKGGDLYNAFVDRAGGVMNKTRISSAGVPETLPGGTRQRAGAYLAANDVPGIKYLDGGSRTAGQGSHNYVAFDDKLIEILRKYGLLPVAAGTAVAGATLPQDGGEY